MWAARCCSETTITAGPTQAEIWPARTREASADKNAANRAHWHTHVATRKARVAGTWDARSIGQKAAGPFPPTGVVFVAAPTPPTRTPPVPARAAAALSACQRRKHHSTDAHAPVSRHTSFCKKQFRLRKHSAPTSGLFAADARVCRPGRRSTDSSRTVVCLCR